MELDRSRLKNERSTLGTKSHKLEEGADQVSKTRDSQIYHQ